MGGDVVGQKVAWQVYEKLSRDQRVKFLDERGGIENEWRILTQSDSAANNVWTDAYIAAFASVRGLRIVSFDSGFKKMAGVNSIILS